MVKPTIWISEKIEFSMRGILTVISTRQFQNSQIQSKTRLE